MRGENNCATNPCHNNNHIVRMWNKLTPKWLLLSNINMQKHTKLLSVLSKDGPFWLVLAPILTPIPTLTPAISTLTPILTPIPTSLVLHEYHTTVLLIFGKTWNINKAAHCHKDPMLPLLFCWGPTPIPWFRFWLQLQANVSSPALASVGKNSWFWFELRLQLQIG